MCINILLNDNLYKFHSKLYINSIFFKFMNEYGSSSIILFDASLIIFKYI